MPGSSTKGKLTILDLKKSLNNIKKILDVGPGWGTYSKLLKEKNEEWDSVEIFEEYIKKFKLNKLYKNIYIQDINDFTPDSKYDLVILGDILEHIEKNKAIKLLKKIFNYCNYCLVSLPLDEETGADSENSNEYWGNIYEKHLAKWSNINFIKTITNLGGEIIALNKFKEMGIYLICSNNSNNYLEEKVKIIDHINIKKLLLIQGDK